MTRRYLAAYVRMLIRNTAAAYLLLILFLFATAPATILPLLRPAADDISLPPPVGTLSTSIRNVFGDPVPGAMLTLGQRRTVALADGTAVLNDIPIGLHDLKVQADGYHDFVLHLRIDHGTNAPLIKYDHGLWPLGFAVDFHVFYTSKEEERQRAFVQIGFANGSDEPVYIRNFWVVNAAGDSVVPPLASPEAYRRLVLMHTALSFAAEPYALILQPWRTIVIEPETVTLNAQDASDFILTVLFGDRARHESTEYDHYELTASMVWEPDFDPHRP